MTDLPVQSFAYATAKHPTILILGSIPGVKSLEAQAYYAHPRNAFWKLMGSLFSVDPEWPYAQRLAALNTAGIALWDVAQECVRPGSLDSNIKQHSVLPNRIPDFLEQYPSIHTIAFNGQAAAKLFKRHFPELLSTQTYKFVSLPSTSPAHASLTFEQKREAWSELINASAPNHPDTKG